MATALTGAVLLVSAANAEAKEVAAVKVCGASTCREVEGVDAGALPLGGTLADPPAAPAEWYRMEVVVRAERVRERFGIAVVPSADRMREDDGAWLRPGSADMKAFRKLVRGLEPRPASSLGLGRLEPPARARVVEVVEPTARPPASGAPAWGWIAAGGAAGLLVLAIAGLGLRRRRRGLPSTAPAEG